MKDEKLNISLLLENVGVDLRIDSFHTSQNVKPSSFAFHSHTAYEVYFIENGNMWVQFEEQSAELQKHDILIIAPDTMHRVKGCSQELKRFNFRFLLHTQKSPASKNSYFLYHPTDTVKDELFHCIEKIHIHKQQANHRLELFRIKTYFSIIVSHLAETLIPAYSISESSDTIDRKNTLNQSIQLDQFFLDHYSHPVTIEDLAKELHYSKTHVNRLLKRYWGLSFSEKLMQTRLHAAKQYLRDSALPIHQIAERCGYSTLRGFELFFEKQTGILPAEYRKNSKNTFSDSRSIGAESESFAI